MSHRDELVVIGAGGHAKVVIATIEAAGRAVGGVFDDGAERWGQVVLGHPVIGAPDASRLTPWRYGVIAVGGNRARQRLAERVGLEWMTVVHPTAWVHLSAVLGPGTVVLAGAVVQPDAQIGAHVIINTGATVDHDCRVGDFAHLSPGVHIAGGSTIGAGAFLGAGAVVASGGHVADWATVAAGQAVIA